MSTSAFQTLLFTKSDGVVEISLNRPRVLNAYNIQMRDDFAEALSAVQDDPEVKVVLISGQGRAFCAGADLSEFGTAPSLVKAREVRWERDVWHQLLELHQPVITAVHGYCIGSGLEIMLLSDLRIAAQGTVFALPEVHLGMIPAAGGTQTLPRNAGTSVALDLLLTGRRFDAAEALKMRLITRVVPEQQLPQSAWDIARQLAGLDTFRLALVKACVQQGADLGLVESLEVETRAAALLLGELYPPEIR